MNRVHEEILKRWPIDRWKCSTIVVALSGGPDSVALLRALHEIVLDDATAVQTRLVVAHLNHRARGIESDRDEEFVKELASELKLEFRGGSIAVPDPQSSEADWRNLRLSFLKNMAQEVQAKWIATGATADDSVETMLHHLFRGSGPAGLAGIRVQRDVSADLTLVHPMIGLWKDELLEYLESLNQAYRIDLTNLGCDYTRNRIRNECIPYLEQFTASDSLKKRLHNAAELIRQEHEVIEKLAWKWVDSPAIRWGQNAIEVDWKDASELDWSVLQCAFVEIWHRLNWPLGQIGFSHWERVRQWIESARTTSHPRKMQLPGPIELRIARQKVQIRSDMESPK